MKTAKGLKQMALGLFLLAPGLPAFASGSVTNSFNPQAFGIPNAGSGYNYFSPAGNGSGQLGVLGSFFDDGRTVWDGIYSVENSIAGGTTALNALGASTLEADTSATPGFLTVNSINGSWAAPANDGFYLFKLVSGDFDVSVQVAAPFNNTQNNFPGLLVRAYSVPDGSRSSELSTNAASENSIGLWRFNEFNLDGEIADNTNGARTEHIFPGSNTDTNSNRGLRIQRVGTNFFCYLSTNGGPWVLLTSASGRANFVTGAGNYGGTNQTGPGSPAGAIRRPDWAGVPLQVGIVQPTFTTNQATTLFADFELTNANIDTGTAPGNPTGLTATAASSNTYVFSWTPGANAQGSLLVVRKGGDPVDSQPADSFTFTGNTNYNYGNGYTVGSATNTFLHHSSNWIAFVGPTNGSGTETAAVNGFGNTNNVYYARVYSYTNSGGVTNYSKNPASFSTNGFGVPQSATVTASPTTNIPAGGATQLTVTAVYSSGDGGNVTADPTVVYTPGDPTVLVVTNGTVTALLATNVNEQVVTQIGGVTGLSVTNNFSTHAPAFADNFTINHDYVLNGIAPSGWDGLFLNFGDVPGANNGTDATNGVTTALNANSTSNGVLSLVAAGGSWQVGGNDGPYLFKQTTGDFQMAAHINGMGTNNNNAAGLMARLFNAGNGQGGGGAGGSESHVMLDKLQAGTIQCQRTIDSGSTTTVTGPTNYTWLLMQRVNSTNFQFYGKTGAYTNPWVAIPNSSLVLAEASNNAAMEAGIFQQMRSASSDFANYDSFVLDGPGITSATPPPPAPQNGTIVLNNDLSVTLTWEADDGAGHPTESFVVARQDAPVTAQPNLGWSLAGAGTYPFGTGQSLGGSNYLVYRSLNPASSTNLSTTVTGLSASHEYYFAIYTFTGTGATKVFNETQPVLLNLLDGIFSNIVTAGIPAIPLNGIEPLQVTGHTIDGGSHDVTQFVTVSGNTNIAYTNGILTGIALSTNVPTTIGFTSAGVSFTNIVNVTVRPPYFSDNFTTNQNYTLNGVAGTGWDGIHNNIAGDIPDDTYPVDAGATNYGANANLTSNGVLTVISENVGWEGGENTGWFLFKRVAGDFQTAVHLHGLDVVAYNMPGVMSRAYRIDTNGNIGAPFMTNGTESWVSWSRFDEFGIGTYARLNGALGPMPLIIIYDSGDAGNSNYWLLMQRIGTTWTFYERLNQTDPWRIQQPLYEGYQTSMFAGQAMEVGIISSPFNASNLTTNMYDAFMLDTTQAPALTASDNHNGTITVSWQNIQFPSDWNLAQTTSLSPTSWTTNNGARTTNNFIVSVVVPDTSPATQYFRLQNK